MYIVVVVVFPPQSCSAAHRILRMTHAGLVENKRDRKFLLHHRLSDCLKFELKNIKRRVTEKSKKH